jgi:alcohol dehydrogenase
MLRNHTGPMLLKMLHAGKIENAKKLITHRFKISEGEKAYEVFQAAAKNNALKIILEC